MPDGPIQGRLSFMDRRCGKDLEMVSANGQVTALIGTGLCTEVSANSYSLVLDEQQRRRLREVAEK